MLHALLSYQQRQTIYLSRGRIYTQLYDERVFPLGVSRVTTAVHGDVLQFPHKYFPRNSMFHETCLVMLFPIVNHSDDPPQFATASIDPMSILRGHELHAHQHTLLVQLPYGAFAQSRQRKLYLRRELSCNRYSPRFSSKRFGEL